MKAPYLIIKSEKQHYLCLARRKELADSGVIMDEGGQRVAEYWALCDALDRYDQANCDHCTCTRDGFACCKCGL